MLLYLRGNDIDTQSLWVNDFKDSLGSTSTTLHVLAKNPFAHADSIAALLELLTVEATFCLDDERMTPFVYAREYNVEGLVLMIDVLYTHR